MDFDTTPHAIVTLDKPRRLEANLWVMRLFRQATGKSLDEIGDDLVDPTGPYFIELVWAMLAPSGDQLSVADVGRLITGRNIRQLAEAVAPVLKEFMPDQEGDEDPLPVVPAPEPAPASTLTSSGPTDASTSDSPTLSSGG